LEDKYKTYLNSDEVCTVLDISKRTLSRHVKSKKLVPVFYKGKNLFDPDMVAHFSAKGDSPTEKLEAQTRFNSRRIAELELRVKTLESLLDVRGPVTFTEKDIPPQSIEEAFNSMLSTKRWDVMDIENTVSDISKLSPSLIDKVGIQLVNDVLTYAELQAKLSKAKRKNILVARCRLLKKTISES